MVSVFLHSIMGQKVFAIELKADQKGFVEQKLDFTGLKGGTYILKSVTEANIYIRKIIVTE